MQIPLTVIVLTVVVAATLGVPRTTRGEASASQAEHCVITDPIVVGGQQVFPSGKYCVPV